MNTDGNGSGSLNKEKTIKGEMMKTTERETEATTEAQETLAINTAEEATMENTDKRTITGKCRILNINKINTEGSIRLDREIEDSKVSAKLRELMRSIEKNGILTPIIVKKAEDGTYNIIDGYRRVEAALHLKYKKLQVIAYDEMDDKEEFLSIVTNTSRKALSPIELGFAYKKLRDRGVYATDKELAEALGVSKSNVSVRIGNLKLDSRIIEDLMEKNPINDQKVLKEIRSVEKIDDAGKSELQFETYTYIVEKKFGRKEALEYIKMEKEAESTTELSGIDSAPQFLKVENDSEIKVVIEKDGLDEDIVNQIEVLLEEIKRLSNGQQEHEAA